MKLPCSHSKILFLCFSTLCRKHRNLLWEENWGHRQKADARCELCFPTTWAASLGQEMATLREGSGVVTMYTCKKKNQNKQNQRHLQDFGGGGSDREEGHWEQWECGWARRVQTVSRIPHVCTGRGCGKAETAVARQELCSAALVTGQTDSLSQRRRLSPPCSPRALLHLSALPESSFPLLLCFWF